MAGREALKDVRRSMDQYEAALEAVTCAVTTVPRVIGLKGVILAPNVNFSYNR